MMECSHVKWQLLTMRKSTTKHLRQRWSSSEFDRIDNTPSSAGSPIGLICKAFSKLILHPNAMCTMRINGTHCSQWNSLSNSSYRDWLRTRMGMDNHGKDRKMAMMMIHRDISIMHLAIFKSPWINSRDRICSREDSIMLWLLQQQQHQEEDTITCMGTNIIIMFIMQRILIARVTMDCCREDLDRSSVKRKK